MVGKKKCSEKWLFVTGGAGFIGSNFVITFLKENPDWSILNVDKLTYAGTQDNLSAVFGDTRHDFRQIDICDFASLEAIFSERPLDGVVHFAAESHVDNSISGPRVFIESNIVGTFNLLECCRQHFRDNQKFLSVSTDEVYGSLGEEGRFTEASNILPNSPYSASKASSDLLVRAYHQTYGLNTTITRCSNNYGPHQHDEKLIPTLIRTALQGEPIPIYGRGTNIRDWLYVLDHVSALNRVFFVARPGTTYNIGGNAEWANLELARKICVILDEKLGRSTETSFARQLTFVTDRPGHDFRYAIEPGKIKQELAWTPSHRFDEAIVDTVNWYLVKYQR